MTFLNQHLSKRITAMFLLVSIVFFFAVNVNAENISVQQNENGGQPSMNDYITIEGEANAKIVLPVNASPMEQYAAQELSDHVELVSGASLPIIVSDIGNEQFSTAMLTSDISTDKQGYYDFVISMNNPTSEDLLITLEQVNIEDGKPIVLIGGQEGLEPNQVLLGKNQVVLVHGFVRIDETTEFGEHTITIDVNAQQGKLATLTLDVLYELKNIFNNGDFEASNPAPWWITDFFYVVSDEAHSGTKSVRLDNNLGNGIGSGYESRLNLTSGHQYKLGVWAKKSTDSDVKLQLVVSELASYTTGLGRALDVVFDLTEEWEYYEFTFETNPDKDETYSFSWFNMYSYGIGTIWMDDFILIDLGGSDEPIPTQPEIPAPIFIGGVNDGESRTVSIILATPDSYPAITEKFEEDIAFLEDSDGFAVRQEDATIYIFGVTPKGTLNGVYDFIEDNLGVLWTRSTDLGTLYDPMPTIPVVQVNYREKSPLKLRAWHLCGTGANGEPHSDPATEIMMSRNKMNSKFAEFANIHLWDWQASVGIEPFNLGHNIQYWLLTSPLYNNQLEYWNTDEEGNYLGPGKGHVNFWSDGAAEAIATSVINFLNTYDIKYVGVGMEDTSYCVQHPEDKQPFEYAPGMFVYPGEDDYLSTVFFTFMNKIARKVKEVHPDVMLCTYAYIFTEIPPRCDIEDNICIVIAPINEDMRLPITTTEPSPNNKVYQNMERWSQKTSNIMVYNYYGCFPYAAEYYERPIAGRVQSDLQYYVEKGFMGVVPEGIVDANTNTWAVNTLQFWLFSKLFWDPYADIDALTELFCQKAYGDAAPHMLRYYKLVEQGWNSKYTTIRWSTDLRTYVKTFILDSGLVDEMQDALDKAWAAANEIQKERIQPIKEAFESNVRSYNEEYYKEDAIAVKTSVAKDVILNTFDFNSEVWAEAVALEKFYDSGTQKPVDGAKTKVRLLWDEEYLYVAYENFDSGIDDLPKAPINSEGSWWAGDSDDVETYLSADPTFSIYYCYFGNPLGEQIRYIGPSVTHDKDTPVMWETAARIFDEEGTENDRWVIIQAIPFESLGITEPVTTETVIYGYFYRGYYAPTFTNIGWLGASVWNASCFKPINLVEDIQTEPEKEITSIKPVSVTTTVGVPPILPSEVTVVYDDNSEAELPVTWESIDPSKYEEEGNFTVYGTVEGTEIKAVANVTVKASDSVITTLSGTDKVNTGEQFEIKYGLAGAKEVSAQDVTISYDEDLFEFTSAESIIDETIIVELKDNDEEGILRMIISSLGADNAINGTAEIISMIFNAIKTGTGKIEVTNAALSNGLGEVAYAEVTSKTIAVAPDRSILINAINNARAILSAAVEGLEIGMYPAGSKARLNQAVMKAEAIAQSSEELTENEIIQATEELNKAVDHFMGLVITGSTGDLNDIPGYDIGDLGIVAYNYGKTSEDPNWDAIKKCDIDGDGKIGLFDLAFIAKKILGN